MSDNKHLHVVSFNIPYPADYGGVIDIYNRIKALNEAGVNIYLHCFKYGRIENNHLNSVCKKVYYYNRSKSIVNQFSILPFIVKSRKNGRLLSNLLKDDFPILFEGIHCCYFLNHPKLKNRLKIVRSHNIEHQYYYELSVKSTSFVERCYYKVEALRLKYFEKIYKHANFIAAISENDKKYFQQKYGKTFLLLPCHPEQKVLSKVGAGNFILYHGNLSVAENEEAALFVVKEIASHIDFQFYIAGKNPSDYLKKYIDKIDNVTLIQNPSNAEMQELINFAHINLLPTFQSTGFKLKLLNSLYNGRFCLCTPHLVDGTNLKNLVRIAHTSEEFKVIIRKLLSVHFTESMVRERIRCLKKYDNKIIISELVDKL